jgi:hypothetical protein
LEIPYHQNPGQSRVRIPADALYISLIRYVQTGSGVHPVSYEYSVRKGCSFARDEAAMEWGWPQSYISAKVKNTWRCTSTPHIWLHDAESHYICTFKELGLSGNVIGTIDRLPQKLWSTLGFDNQSKILTKWETASFSRKVPFRIVSLLYSAWYRPRWTYDVYHRIALLYVKSFLFWLAGLLSVSEEDCFSVSFLPHKR